MRVHNIYSRDGSLRKLSRINRWLVAASIGLTALFAEAAAHAFPGKRTTSPTVRAGHAAARSTHRRRHGAAGSAKQANRSLRPPAQAPQATTDSTPPADSTTTSEDAPAPQAAPEQSKAPAEEPAREPQPTHEAEPAPVQESAPPVVSGGS